MKTFDEKTTVVGISEFRNRIKEILKEAKDHKVVIEKRNKLIAVLLDIDKYNKMQKTLDALEDFALGYLANQRAKASKSSDYRDIEDVIREL